MSFASPSSSTASTESQSSKMKPKKFTARDMAVYPFLKENPEAYRTFLSSFLPTPGGSGGSTIASSDADAAVPMFVTMEMMSIVTGNSAPILENQEVFVPQGAIDQSRKEPSFLHIMFQMFDSRFLENMAGMSDGICYVCKKSGCNAYVPEYVVLSGSIFIHLKVTHYPVCDGSKCSDLMRHAIIMERSKENAYVRMKCKVCDNYENEPHQFQCCPRCKTTVYCSRACQEKDWKEHKKICKKISKFMPVCNHCKKLIEEKTYKECGRCQVAIYCSAKCQKADWKVHKKVCTSTSTKKPLSKTEDNKKK